MTEVALPLPQRPEDVDDAFLGAVFGRPVRVLGREPVGVGVGQAGQVVRLRLDGPPGSLVLKLPPAAEGNRATQQVFDIYRREARFYGALAPALPLRLPRCHWAGFDGPTGSAAVLLEDLTGWLTVSQVEGAPLERARTSLRLLARLHAWGWERDQSFPERLDAEPFDRIGPAYRQVFPVFVDRFGAVLPPGAAAAGERIGQAYEAITARAMQGPLTLCHGDFRIENLMFDDATGGCAVVDWQIPYVGPAAADLAMFLTQSLEPPLRAAHEAALIAGWHAELTAGGVDHPLERVAEDYRLLAMQATMIPVLAGATYDLSVPRSRALLEAIVFRAFTAVRELDSLALLG